MFLSGSYKFTLTASSDVVIRTTDNVTSFNATTETTEGFFQAFSGDGATTAFTLSENLGTDEKALFVFSEKEYVTNGAFTTDTAWSKGAGWTIAAGVATATGAISTAIEQSAANTLVNGKSYSVKYTITRSAGTITLSVGGTAGTARSASGTYSETIIAAATQTISFGTAGFTGTLDDVTITETSGPMILNPSTYTVNGTSLTITPAPAIGTQNILVFAPYTLIGAAGAAQVAADEAIAAAADAQAFVEAGAYYYLFDSSTTMADPGTGDFRLNNATIASATAIAIDALSASTGNPDVSDAIAVWGASTNTVKGQIKITKLGTPATFAVFNITAAVTDNTGWLEIAVAYVAGNGTLTNADGCYMQFIRSGDLGATGAQGPTGTVSGAASAPAAIDDKVLFLDTSSADGLSYDTAQDVVAATLLDEDNFASDSATRAPTQQSVKAYVDAEVVTLEAAIAAAGTTLQFKTYTSSTQQSSTNYIPADTSIPQSTEGVEVFSQSFTPTAGTSKIRISGVINFSQSQAWLAACCLFVDSTADAAVVNMCGEEVGTGGANTGVSYSFIVDATNTTARTYKIRIGSAGGTFYINRSATANLYGTGKVISTMAIEEIKV